MYGYDIISYRVKDLIRNNKGCEKKTCIGQSGVKPVTGFHFTPFIILYQVAN